MAEQVLPFPAEQLRGALVHVRVSPVRVESNERVTDPFEHITRLLSCNVRWVAIIRGTLR